jgi:hypothetical protein
LFILAKSGGTRDISSLTYLSIENGSHNVLPLAEMHHNLSEAGIGETAHDNDGYGEEGFPATDISIGTSYID